MKKSIALVLKVLLIITLLINEGFAQQCTVATNVNGIGGVGSYNFDIGQSFTTCQSGRLASVTIGKTPAGSGSVRVQVRSGDGASGTVLLTTNFENVGGGETKTFNLSSHNLILNAGAKYTILFLPSFGDTPQILFGNYSNAAVDYYTGGRLYGPGASHNDMFGFIVKTDLLNKTLSPLDQATEVSRLSQPHIQFSRSMVALTGDVTISNIGAATSETVPVADLVIDRGLVTIPNATILEPNTEYEILIPAGALKSTDEIPFKGFISGDWTFTTTTDRVPAITSTADVITNLSPIPFSIDFTESVTGFDDTDLTITNGVASNFAGSGTSYTVDITPVAEGIVKVETLADVTVEGNEAGQDSLEYDITNPTVTITTAASGITNRSPIEIIVQFSEPITGFDADFLDLTNAEIVSSEAVNDSTFSVMINASNEGILTVDAPASTVLDLAGNGNDASAQFSIDYQIDLNEGLISFYPLNTLKFDVNRKNADLTDQLGTPALVSDHHGQPDGAYNFSSGILYQAAFNNAPIENGFSISTWIKPTSEMGVISAKRVIYEHANSSTLYYSLNALRLDLNGTTDQYFHPVVLPANTWTHLLVSVAVGGNVYLYIDNIQYDLGAAPASLTETISALTLGAAGNGSSVMNGDMDEIRYYGKALHPVEAFELYNQAEYLLLSETLEICANDSFTTPEGDELSTDGNYFYIDPSGDSSPDTFVSLTLNTIPAPQVIAVADNLIVCDGNEVTLTGQGAVSYVWDNGVIDGVPFIPTATKTYTVTGTAANGCENTSQVTVQLVPRDFDDEVLTTTAPEFCPDGSPFSATISTSSSAVGVNYSLRNSVDNSVVDGPIPGTGSALDFNAGTLTGTTTFNVFAEQPAPATNYALDFDGSNDFVDVPVNASFDYENGYTFEAWVKGPLAGATHRPLFSVGNGSVSDIEVYAQASTNSIVVVHDRGEAATFGGYTYTNPPNNVWYHLAVTYDGSNLKVYYDGIEQSITNSSFAPAGALTKTGGLTMKIGKVSNTAFGGSGAHFLGQIDEVRVWTTVKTKADLQETKNACFDGTETDLEYYFRMDDNTGTIVTDLVNGINGTMTNMDAASDWVVSGSNLSCVDYFSCSFEMTQEITIGDQTGPTVALQDITVQLGENGIVSLIASDFDNGSTDNCTADGDLIFTLDQPTFGCDDIGSHDVMVTVTDEGGNSSSASANVTVESFLVDEIVTIADASLCPGESGGTTVSLASSQVGVNYYLRNSSDNSVVDGPLVGTGSVMDFNTGVLTQSTTFNVVGESSSAGLYSLNFDGVDDYITAPIQSTFEYQNGYTMEAWINGPLTSSTKHYPIFHVGNATTSDIEVYLQNSTNKLIVVHNRRTSGGVTYSEFPTPPANTWYHLSVTYDGTSIRAYYNGVLQSGNAASTAGGLLNKTTGAEMTLGYVTNSASWASVLRNFAGKMDEVRFWDSARSDAELQENMNSCLVGNEVGLISYYNLDDGQGTVAVDLIGGQNGTIQNMDSEGSWVEGAENIACERGTCQFEMSTEVSITVEDNTLPTAVAQDITIQLDVDGNASISVEDIDNGSSDNCNSTITLSIDKTDFTCADLGTNTVTLTVTDGANNQATTTAIVTVEETTLPTVVAQDITIQLDATGNASISAIDLDNGSSDNCSAFEDLVFSLDQTEFTCADIGPNTLTFTVTDASGNVASTAVVVTVEDVTGPTVITQDITVALDANGAATISATDVDNGSSDECLAAITMTLSQSTFNCNDLGANVVTLAVTDESGNQSSAEATVTIVDLIEPTIVAQNVTARLDGSGNISVDPAFINTTSFDNCSLNLTFALSQTDFDCSHIGANTVSFSATDESGNTSTQEVIITVEENSPMVITQDITVELNANGVVSITPSEIDNGSSDDCTGLADLTMSLDIVDFSCEDIGAPNQVTLSVTDLAGNISSGIAFVTVVDLIAPTVVTQDISLVLDGSGNATITSADIDNGSSDNCTSSGDLAMSLDVTNFDINDLGANTVILTVTDASGNEATSSATVTISDKEAQVVTYTGVADKTFGDANFDITATLDSGLPVTYIVINGGLSIASSTTNSATFSITGAGNATVEVTNDGDDTYAPFQETITIIVAKANQVLTVDQIANKSVVAQPFNVNASVDTNLALDYAVTGPATISGNVITLDGTVGTVSVTVSQAGTDNYNLVSETISFEVVEQQSQTISFTDIPDVVYGAADQTLSATSSSTLAVTFNVISGPAVLTGSSLSITGAGTVVVEALQAGDEDFLSASSQQTFTVSQASLVVTADDYILTYGDAIPTLTFAYDGFVNGEDATALIAEPTISTNATAASDAGDYEVVLDGGEAANYTISLIDGTLTINMVNQVITIDPIEDKEPTDVAFDVVASVNSDLGLTYDVSGPATISGTTITLDGSEGTVTVTVSQAGDVNHTAATASVSFEVAVVLGAKDQLVDLMKIYPNPVAEYITIDTEKLVNLRIFGLNGQLIKEINQVNGRVDLSTLTTGTYLIEVSIDNERTTLRINKAN